MPDSDILYEARFRPNPFIKILTRFTDENGNATAGGPDAKGRVRIYPSQVDDNQTIPIQGTDYPGWGDIGDTVARTTLRPTE